MKKINDLIFINNLPHIDLHGYDRDTARFTTNDFINDNIKTKNEFIVIVHGIGSGVVRNSVHETLKRNKKVLEYKTYNFNSGCTIVKIKVD
ncbi:MAG TPA: Smr/MutS family protein [Tenericutes bacterium]|nr:Smr/MutS family protein [Mycoplasmatota bacterium]